jgi:hypothetical protein
MARPLPEDLKRPLETFRALSEGEAARFLDTLTRARASLSRDGIVDSVAEGLPDVSRDDVAEMLQSLIGWAGVIAAGQPSTDLVDNVTAGLELSKEDEVIFRTRFEAALRAPAIAVTARAVEAMRGGPGDSFVRATHSLDLRVLPTPPTEEASAAAVLVHVLRIETHQTDGEHNSIALRLDDEDLARLRSVLDDAISRVPAAEALAASGGITLVRADIHE